MHISGNHIGDACENDSDGDVVVNTNDTCPNIPSISKTSFLNYTSVNLQTTSSSGEVSPSWQVHGNGAEITQLAVRLMPAMLIGFIYIMFFCSVEVLGWNERNIILTTFLAKHKH